jgi:uncharacterized damage-inducible protein DinB
MRAKILVPALVVLATTPSAQSTAKPTPTANISALKRDVLANMATVTDKFIQLANAVPADRFTWRPAPGVRSIAEVFLHVSNAQYVFGTSIGIVKPAGYDATTFETSTTDKAQIIAQMKAAFAAMTTAIQALPDNSGDATFKLFDTDYTNRKLLILETDHNAEHLGQSIAYARVNGVVPPWSVKM